MHIGSTISHYRIVEKLGEGGMGVVYKAEDTTLERSVALKFLADHLLNDAEAKERFLREAKAAAGIDHPNICHVYEIGEEQDKTFISMAFIEGQTLEDRIAQGPLPIKDALDVGRQIAEGLQAAHAKGIVHRDIKPANVIVASDGRASIMDFGLARLTEASRLTKVDTAMGTVAYMSPEQAQGMEVDSRTDIWALGCVVYEMVCGQRPFKGEYDQALLYEIVHEEAQPLTSLRAGVPMELEFIVGECLTKERDDRTESAREVARKLRTLADKLRSGKSTILRTVDPTARLPGTTRHIQDAGPVDAAPPGSVVMSRGRQRVLFGVAAFFGLASLALAFLYSLQVSRRPDPVIRRFSIAAPVSMDTARERAGLVVSPDGRYIAFTAPDDGLWVQDLSEETPRALEGTQGAYLPFWSPDSQSIVYAVQGELRRIPVRGGASGLICRLPGPGFFGGAWSPDGESIVAGGSGSTVLFEVSAQGGPPRPLVVAQDIERSFVRDPHFASANVLLFVGTTDREAILARDLATGETRELGEGTEPIYDAASSHLIYRPQRNDINLWARPFSPDRMEYSGSGFPVRRNARTPSVSNEGTLVYFAGSTALAKTLVWRDRQGEILQTVGQPQLDMSQVTVSPDDKQAAVRSSDSGNYDIWIHDLVRQTKTRFTFEDLTEALPAWSPSGREVAYRLADTPNRLMVKAADGTGEAASIVEATQLLAPDWSRNGRYLAYMEVDSSTGADIRYLTLEPDGKVSKPITFLATEADESIPKLSPDERLVAYVSNESGRGEVYIKPFPEGAGKWQVSVNGGEQPRWSRDGTELFYVEGAELMAVTVSTEPILALAEPEALFESEDLARSVLTPNYDVSSDGQRFLTMSSVGSDEEESSNVRVVLNWYEEFRDRE